MEIRWCRALARLRQAYATCTLMCVCDTGSRLIDNIRIRCSKVFCLRSLQWQSTHLDKVAALQDKTSFRVLNTVHHTMRGCVTKSLRHRWNASRQSQLTRTGCAHLRGVWALRLTVTLQKYASIQSAHLRGCVYYMSWHSRYRAQPRASASAAIDKPLYGPLDFLAARWRAKRAFPLSEMCY